MTRYAIVTREFAFEVCHAVPESRGKPPQTYRLQIALRGPILEQRDPSDDGMAMEKLSHAVNMLLLVAIPRGLIHGALNQNGLNTLTSTAPNLVHWIWDALIAAGVPDQLLHRIRLWENEEGYVEITHQEREIYSGFE